MSFYKTLLEKGILPIGDLLVGTSFIKQLRKFRHFDTLSLEELEKIQSQRLRDILTCAGTGSSYYRSLFRYDEGVSPTENLKRLPLLTKDVLRERSKEILTAGPAGLIHQSTSGSSGIQTTIYLSKRERSFPQAQQTRWWEWCGYRIGDSILQTGMTPKRGYVKGIKDVLFNTLYTPAFSLSKDEIREVLLNAKARRIRYFFGYASSLFLFAEVAEEYQLNVRFEAIVCWGDKMFDHYRKKLESVFGGKVYETYGCAEGLMIAAQKDLPYLYIMTPTVYLELLDENGYDVADGEIGQVVVTGLTARSFPLIRYCVGDLAIRLPESEYPVNRELNYPLLQRVIGRDTDIVRMKSGKSLIVHTFTGIFEFFPEIQQFKVIQKDINGIEIEYIPRAGFHQKILEEVRKQILSHVKEDFEIAFREVSYIAATASGKPQIIQCFLPKK